MHFPIATGDRLPLCAEGRIDFVWSYDAFVHMERQVIRAYLGEIQRTLKPSGAAVIHHSNVENLADHRQDKAPGRRSAMNDKLMRELAHDAGLLVTSQFTYWDDEKKMGAPRYGDLFTEFRLNFSSNVDAQNPPFARLCGQT
jgi:hypothetical protein